MLHVVAMLHVVDEVRGLINILRLLLQAVLRICRLSFDQFLMSHKFGY